MKDQFEMTVTEWKAEFAKAQEELKKDPQIQQHLRDVQKHLEKTKSQWLLMQNEKRMVE